VSRSAEQIGQHGLLAFLHGDLDPAEDAARPAKARNSLCCRRRTWAADLEDHVPISPAVRLKPE